MLITKIFTFDAAHALTRYYGKCENVHGHTYRLEVTVEGPVQENGMVVDFVLLKRVVKRRVIDRLDHQHLNDHFDNPSAENVVLWIWEQLADMAALLGEELKNPNLGEDLKAYLKDVDELDCSGGAHAVVGEGMNRAGVVVGHEADVVRDETGEAGLASTSKKVGEIRLVEVKLAETHDNIVTYRG